MKGKMIYFYHQDQWGEPELIPCKENKCSVCGENGPSCIVPSRFDEWRFQNMCTRCLDSYLNIYPVLFSWIKNREYGRLPSKKTIKTIKTTRNATP